MSPTADELERTRQARLLSHTARKYSRQLRRVEVYLRAHDRLAQPRWAGGVGPASTRRPQPGG